MPTRNRRIKSQPPDTGAEIVLSEPLATQVRSRVESRRRAFPDAGTADTRDLVIEIATLDNRLNEVFASIADATAARKRAKSPSEIASLDRRLADLRAYELVLIEQKRKLSADSIENLVTINSTITGDRIPLFLAALKRLISDALDDVKLTEDQKADVNRAIADRLRNVDTPGAR